MNRISSMVHRNQRPYSNFVYRFIAAVAILAAAPAVGAQDRNVFDSPHVYIQSSQSAEHRRVRDLFRDGRIQEAEAGWLSLAEGYVKSNRLQEAAWTYAQAGHGDVAEDLIARLEQELRTGKIVSSTGLPMGVTHARQVTFESGLRAILKFTEFKMEPAAYQIDRLLGLNLVPATVLRKVDGKVGSLQVWIPDAKNSFSPSRNFISGDLSFFDFLIGNRDRHSGNFMLREGDFLVAIDHGRILGVPGLYGPMGDPIPRYEVYERLRSLTESEIRAALSDVLRPDSIDAFLKSRTERLRFIEERIAKQGIEATFRGMDFRIRSEDRNLENQRVMDAGPRPVSCFSLF